MTMNTALREPTQEEIDTALEERIERARVTMTEATDTQEKREAYEELRWLISQRSPQRVSEMEARLPDPWRS